MGLILYLIAKTVGSRLDEVEDRVVFLEHQVRDLKNKLKQHGIE